MLARSSVALWMVLVLLGLAPGCKKGLGEPCEEDGECRGECAVISVGSSKRVKTCTELCDGKNDCGEGAVCHLGDYCALSCDANTPCPGESICEPFYELCVAPCTDDTDCDQGACVDGLCH